MAIASFTDYRTRAGAPRQSLPHVRSSITAALSAGWFSLWRSGPDLGATPTTAEVPGRAVSGALGQENGSGTLRVARLAAKSQNVANLILCDRLSHQGGLSAVVTGAQTTNLPTAALTRYTTGAGVFLALEIYTQIGATGTTITASYTNEAGVAGRTTGAITFGGTDNREAGRLLVLPLQQGDLGVRAVANVNIVATTGTAGNFGVTLLKPLEMFPLPVGFAEVSFYDAILQRGGHAPQVQTDACLFWACTGTTSNSTGVLAAKLDVLEE